MEPNETSNRNSFKTTRREIQEISLDEKCCDKEDAPRLLIVRIVVVGLIQTIKSLVLCLSHF